MNIVEQSNSLQVRLTSYAAKASIEASKLRPGLRRDALLRKILEANNAIQIEKWLTSPGLRAPI